MRAIQYRTIGREPELVDIPTPEPGPGQVLLQVTAAGVCHSDAFLMGLPREQYTFGLPLTLGHEGAGRVAAVGAGVDDGLLGVNALVYGPWGCGQCWHCAQGMENYCSRAADLGIVPPGLGAPGAIAEYMIVDSPRHLVPIGELDPVTTVPLTDAGLTPYHAITRSLGKLRAGSSAVVIGAGGLGHVAIQLLRHLSPARVIALDVSEDKLELARSVGAHEVLRSDAGAAEGVRRFTGPAGAALVLDFVGMQPTLDLSMAVAGVGSDVAIVGLGDGQAAAQVGFFRGAYETNVAVPYWGARHELIELVELARQGVLDIAVERFDLDDGVEAYRRLLAGTLRGRAVIVP
ncbi:NAD(P)-dependent alcohol dehydrogenase [Rhodococcus opacus]|uniref:NAD(P)-dependent alcohol dehydrogenase n=1 Tax=Rhodococcus TaxID=1827 RepID=UPI0002A3D681|nr:MULTISPECIES: NAD(P)-dependent alcohol dehydrogenase [Rhodococcus]ELB92210.1 zinc binding alcohol dehydrogenase [Rhodococcus wratislaviensis IFP 2016]NHU48977.1 NAD(P)-dependent alcohol dehydrogenase [Rhodococcus sp. A14]MBA8959173.1 propanol-preferring alcohol dehydrogenase [Rhodococcus opacus]MBP2204738.1 propanol-preferring alcohol dehydrogenase [Rhodococcus opacus]MDI9935180.1 NAD(P)-dependent alcohol dehydrogenase [Rhodococcus sp. IEGM 1351]